MNINPGLISLLGLNPKAVHIYSAALTLGEASIQQLAELSGIRRTTIYYILPSLLSAGVLIQTRRNKKTYYLPDRPENVLKRAQDKLLYAEKNLNKDFLQATPKSRIYFLYGPNGFKQVWEKILSSKCKSYSIITDGSSFLDFVKEKYILHEIIALKRKRGVSSRQIIVDSTYARAIVAKDSKENRISRYLPRHNSLPFTQVIGETCTAFISPRTTNTIFIVEDEQFTKTQQTLFNQLWESLSTQNTV